MSACLSLRHRPTPGSSVSKAIRPERMYPSPLTARTTACPSQSREIVTSVWAAWRAVSPRSVSSSGRSASAASGTSSASRPMAVTTPPCTRSCSAAHCSASGCSTWTAASTIWRPATTWTGRASALWATPVAAPTAFFSAAVLPRLRYAMPSCYFCTFRDSIMSIYHCADNYVPGLLQYAEMADVMGLFAPRPVVLVAGEHDAIFPVAATRRAFADLQQVYAAVGAADRCHLVVGPRATASTPTPRGRSCSEELQRAG